jgi:CheY-like chemotaxis protein
MKKRTILFVDDDKDYLGLVENLLVQAGITAQYAASGEEAVGLLKRGPFTVMVTDLNMPGMDGYELAMIAKELCPDIEVVMITGAISPDVMGLAAQAGISGVLAKPVLPEQILKIAGGTTACPAVPDTDASWTVS